MTGGFRLDLPGMAPVVKMVINLLFLKLLEIFSVAEKLAAF
jgi:hypothetical protein